jgi:hypothetical protein
MIFFPCGCWLAEDMGDGKLEREIKMGHAPAPMGTGTLLIYAFKNR